MSTTTENGAGEFPLPTRPPAGPGTQSTSKPPSMFRSQQTGESYPDLISLKRELERAQKDRDRDNLDRDQAILERYKAILDRDLLMAEWEQEQRHQKSVANCDQMKSEIERLRRRQQVVASGK